MKQYEGVTMDTEDKFNIKTSSDENNELPKHKVNISVRNLVEFILKAGDIDNRRIGRSSVDAMQEGSRIHRKIQKSMGPNYRAEVPLSITLPISRDGVEFDICIEGRCDGLLVNDDIDEESPQNPYDLAPNQQMKLPVYQEDPKVIIDEIKGSYMDLAYLKEAIFVHKAQAMCYAYIYGREEGLEEIGTRITYCNLETEKIKYFNEIHKLSELEDWFLELINEFGKWASWQYRWSRTRNRSIKNLEFPFEYRPGQKKLTRDVYLSIIREKRLFVQAPTGVGKTISTVFPTIKAMGEEKIKKIFYLTAKTITRTVAEETVALLRDDNLLVKSITLTAKDKVCVLDKAQCNPLACERAKGHYDRVNDCVFELINNEDTITREVILEYGEKYKVCPFEMGLDASLWSDFVICDYNYAFDPNVYLRRFFGNTKQDYVFLIDEAHNLVNRACSMYSATLYKEDILKIRRLVGKKSAKLNRALNKCNKDMLGWKREWNKLTVIDVDHIEVFATHLISLLSAFSEFFEHNPEIKDKDEVLQFYFEVGHFLNMYEVLNDKYLIYLDYSKENDLMIKLLCVDPSDNLKAYLDKIKSAIFFSATLLPIKYYRGQLGGREDDYAIYAPSPFPVENKLTIIGDEVSTRFSRRSPDEYKRILDYIRAFVNAKVGNYLVFFSSYKMMEDIADIAGDSFSDLVMQNPNMNEIQREEFLEGFKENPTSTKVGFCVLGGIFGEGIDLKGERLIGTIIVGPGLPMIGEERELLREYYDNRSGKGFNYAYLYQGMNKVLQAGGRVIRTMEDKGVVLLLDDRFLQGQYQKLLPREWLPHIVSKSHEIEGDLQRFWDGLET